MLGDLLARYEVLRAVVEFRDSPAALLEHGLPPTRATPCNNCGTGAYVPKRAEFARCVNLPWAA
jgi:hypothetical protein